MASLDVTPQPVAQEHVANIARAPQWMTGAVVPTDSLRAAVEQLSVAERLRRWSTARLSSQTTVALECEADAITIATGDDRVRLRIPRMPVVEDRSSRETRDSRTPDGLTVYLPLSRLREAMHTRLGNTSQTALDFYDDRTCHVRPGLVLSHASHVYRTFAPPLLRAALDNGTPLPLPLAWATRAHLLPPDALAEDDVLRRVLETAGRTLNNREYEFFDSQLRRWTHVTSDSLASFTEDERHRLAQAADAQLVPPTIRQEDIDTMAALALAAYTQQGEWRPLPEIVRGRVPTNAFLRTMNEHVALEMTILPSESRRVSDVLASGILQATADQSRSSVEATLQSLDRWREVMRRAPMIGDAERSGAGTLAAGHVRELDASYALTMAQVPRSVRAAALLANGHTNGPRRLAALSEDDHVVAEHIAMVHRSAFQAMPATHLASVDDSLERTETAERSVFYGQGAAKRRAVMRDRPTDVMAYLADERAEASKRVLPFATEAPTEHAARRGSATMSEPRVLSSPGVSVVPPSVHLGLLAAEYDVPVLLHPDSGLAIVATPECVVVAHPHGIARVTDPLRYAARALHQSTPDDLIPLSGADVVLLHAWQANAGESRETDTDEMWSSPDEQVEEAVMVWGTADRCRIELADGSTLSTDTSQREDWRMAASRALADIRSWNSEVVIPPRSGRLPHATADRFETAMNEVRAMRPVREADDFDAEVNAERIVVAVEHNPTTGRLTLLGGGPTHGYLEREVAPHANPAWFTPEHRARMTTADVSADALAVAVGMMRELTEEREYPTLAVHEPSGTVSLRSSTVTAVVPTFRRVRAAEEAPLSASSRTTAVIMDRLA